MNKIVSYLLICSALLLIGCSGNEYTCVSDAPKELIGDFKSYQTIQDFERKVKMKTDSIVVFENSKLPKTDLRPEFSIYTIILPEYKIENVTGKLEASFFNDRLMSVRFYPNDIKEFESLLKRKHNINLENRENISIDCVEINRWTDFEGNEYFGWSDMKLIKEQNDWISQHA
jgi:hypothetical protein